MVVETAATAPIGCYKSMWNLRPRVCSTLNCNSALDCLTKNARRDIRRGLRGFTVRLCTWDELAEYGFQAHADTTARHGYGKANPNWLAAMGKRNRETPFNEIWGARDDQSKLAEWMTFIKIDDWALVDIARSCTDALKGCPNNAICYEATRRMIVEQGRKYVSYGLSSIQVDVNEKSMHKYKIRMGYEPIEMCRVFQANQPLKMILKSSTMSWAWEKAAKMLPSSAAPARACL